MPIAYFSSLSNADVIQLQFERPDGGIMAKSLLVDSGFCGSSCFVLSPLDHALSHAAAPTSQTSGALVGRQKRVLVRCQVPQLAFNVAVIAILADLSPFALSPGIDGIAGLRFLRQFQSWGAEKTKEGAWQFFLETT